MNEAHPMGTLRFFEEVVSFKIRRTFGFADYTFASFSAFSEDPATTRVPGGDASVRSFHGSSTPPRRSTPATRRPEAHAEDRRRTAR